MSAAEQSLFDETPTEQQIAKLNRVYVIDDKKVKPSAKQFAFVRFYLLNGRNATQAAIDAGYSKKSAQQIGSQNLSKLLVIKMLEELERIMLERYVLSYDKKRAMLGRAAIHTGAIVELKDKEGNSLGKNLVDGNVFVKVIGEDNKMAGHHKEKETVQPEIHIHFTSQDAKL